MKASTARRDRRVAAADKHLLEAGRLLADAMADDEKLHHADRIGAMNLAQASDDARRISRGLAWATDAARDRRRDLDRAVAEERAAGGPEAYARQRGLA